MRREEIITRYVAGRDVLDVGGIDHYALAEKHAADTWLHAIVARHARTCLGIDILQDRVEEARTHGYRFETGNAENLNYDSCFDVIVAGEFVEHLYNMGLFLDSAWRALRPDGHLIITTPNNFSFSKVLYALLQGREVCHPEHTCWYSRQTLDYVVTRHGFELLEGHVLPRAAKSSVVERVYEALSHRRPILAEVLVHVYRRLPAQNKYGDKW